MSVVKKTLLAVLASIAVIVVIVVAVRVHAVRAVRAKSEAAVHERPVPVSVAVVQRIDVPIYVEGLGTVIALQMVVVHSQVDGPFVKVSFVEGQHVQKGIEIALVDPWSFEV